MLLICPKRKTCTLFDSKCMHRVPHTETQRCTHYECNDSCCHLYLKPKVDGIDDVVGEENEDMPRI